MKILIATPYMKVGGISSSLANWLYYLKGNTDHEVDIVVFNDEFDEKYAPLKEEFNFITIQKFKPLRLTLKDVGKYKFKWSLIYFIMLLMRATGLAQFFLKKVFKSYTFDKTYDLAISYANDAIKQKVYFLGNDFVEFSVKATNKAAWIHNDLEKLGFTRDYILKRYKNFDFIVNVSQSCKNQLDELTPEYKNKSLVVSNPVNVKEIENRIDEEIQYTKEEGIPTFVTVARINPQKRIDRLMEVAHILHKDNLDFRWYILGGGPNMEKFVALLKKRGMDKKVFFLGFINNPYPYIKMADYFVLTSDYEAQPVAVLEALTIGTPIITTDIPIMYKFIKEGKTGFIAQKNATSISHQLKQVISKKIQLKGFEFNYSSYADEFNVLIERCNK